MIKLEQAYHKVFDELYVGQRSDQGIEDRDGYLFFPRPIDSDKNSAIMTGTKFPYVYKSTGECILFDLFEQDLDNPKRFEIQFKSE